MSVEHYLLLPLIAFISITTLIVIQIATIKNKEIFLDLPLDLFAVLISVIIACFTISPLAQLYFSYMSIEEKINMILEGPMLQLNCIIIFVFIILFTSYILISILYFWLSKTSKHINNSII